MTIDKQCDIHAEEMGAAAKLEEAREAAVKSAVETLFSNKKGVMVEAGQHVGFVNVYESMCAGEDVEALRQMCNGDYRPARDLYSEVAYSILYPYADFLISNNSQPF